MCYTGTDEYDDDRVHNDVNEITERDTDDDETADHNLVYDAAGNLTDDDEEYEYVYDAFYRLRKVNDQSQALVAEHRYNGLGYRIAEHADTDDDQDVDGSDEWHHFCYDERWRVVAMFVNSSSIPKEEFMHHGAGNSGFGGASYIDEVAIRDRDVGGEGTLDERIFYCQNWRHDVVCVVDGNGDQLEMVRYSAYGVPFGLPGGDADSDGDCDSADVTQIQTWISAPAYDVRGDMDLDGDVDSTDKGIANGSPFQGVTMGWSVLSSIVMNARGLAAYVIGSDSLHHVRNRSFSGQLGSWSTRDPAKYVDGMKFSQLCERFCSAGGSLPCLGIGSGTTRSTCTPTFIMGPEYIYTWNDDSDEWILWCANDQQIPAGSTLTVYPWGSCTCIVSPFLGLAVSLATNDR